MYDSGFEYSTLDVGRGYYKAFERLGFEVMSYDTLNALDMSKKALWGKTPTIHQLTELMSGPILNTIIQDKIDLLIVIHGYYMNPSIIMSARQIGCKTALILTDDPMQVDISTQWSKVYDYIFSNERHTVKYHGKNCHYLPMAVDEEIFKPQEVEDKYKSDILIAGSFYKERIDFINDNKCLQEVLLKYNTCFVGASKSNFNNPKLNDLIRGNKISYEEMALYTAGAKVCIDIPRNEFSKGPFGLTNSNCIEASCLSPRIFECGASNTMCITNNRRGDIRTLFPDCYVPTWDEPEDLCEKIKSVLEASFKKTLKEEVLRNHTYLHRVKELVKILDISPSKKCVTTSIQNIPIVEQLNEHWIKNFEENKKFYTKERSLAYLANKLPGINVSINIVSNGPSVTNTHQFIHEKKSSLSLLLNDAIRIYGLYSENCIAMCIHPTEELYKRCYNEMINMPLITSTLVYHKILTKWNIHNKDFYMFNTSKEPGIKELVSKLTEYPVLGTGLTVGYSALTVANYLGFKKINIFGLDFCFLNNQRYADDELKFNDIKNQHLTIVSSLSGKPVFTTEVMLQSKNSCLKFIEEHPEVRFEVYGDGILYSKRLHNLINHG